ncbi:hypothetical protein HKX48_005115 [Thoreauomyces humboldtii]|nr:hypothetical protein HKX48_005115 [Thoreauomyces humboldtii]
MLVSKTIFALSVLASALAAPAVTTTVSRAANPFDGAKGYVDIDWFRQIKSTLSTSNPSLIDKIMFPTAVWIDSDAALPKIARHLKYAAKMATAAKPIVIQFVVYNLPGRDCHALASNGEIPTGGLAEYKAYIDTFKSMLTTNASPNVRVVLVVEPDSLPNIATNSDDPKCAAAASDYTNGVAYALARLTGTNIYSYLDAGHGGWLGWENNLEKIGPIFTTALNAAKAINPATTLQGFSTNVANYDPFQATVAPARQYSLDPSTGYDYNLNIDENRYTDALANKFASQGLPTRFIVDTGRAGTPGIRSVWGSWCNIKGAGIGPRPQVNPAPQVDAFVWVKPPGQSDGASGPLGGAGVDGFCVPETANGVDSLGGAPHAGNWFPEHFLTLVANANPAL